LAPRRLCNLVWYYLSDGADEKGRAKLEAALHKPLPGRDGRVSAAVVDFEKGMFKKALATMSGGTG
jgi:hypothetical protein